MMNGKLKWNWLALIALIAGVWMTQTRTLAQEEAVGETNDVSVEMEATSVEAAATDEPESEWAKQRRERSERRRQFWDSFETAKQSNRHREALVVFGRDAELKANETTEAVVVIGGSATVRGKVRDAVVAIGGDVLIEGGEVGDAVVAVLGSVKIGEGSKIYGDVVSVGGGTDVAESAKVDGEIQAVDFGNFGLPDVEWLKRWFIHCVLKLRPLAPQVGWVWGVAGAVFLFYLLVAAALPKPVSACVSELTRRPATTFFMGLLTKLLVPVIIIVLAATGIGILVLPFLVAALFFGALIGKVAFLEYLGLSVGRLVGAGDMIKPILGLFIGAVVLALLYMVPVFGLIVMGVTAVWGLGVAVTVAFGSMRRETPERPTGLPPSGGGTAVPSPSAGMNFNAETVASGDAGMNPNPASAPTSFAPTGSLGAMAPSGLGDAWTCPRAGFWERMGAAFLDIVLVSLLGALVGGPPLGFLVALAYFSGMWAWKGTTIGGIVVNLKVVRLDDKPITLSVALVRGLAAAFSAIVAFVGFFWIAWDKDRQGWHDKIAGTVVIRVPRGVPLVCL